MDHLEIKNVNEILNFTASEELTALLADFKMSLNAYLKKLGGLAREIIGIPPEKRRRGIIKSISTISLLP